MQDKIKNYFGRLDFTDTVSDTTGPAEAIICGWDLVKECKHRVWHPFWDGLLLSLKQKDAVSGPEVARLQVGGHGDMRSRMRSYASKHPARMQDLKELTANNGLVRIKVRRSVAL